MSIKIETIPTKKFKHIDISFKFIKKYNRQSALDDYAICRIIGEYSNIYNTKIKMSTIKDNLYGMSVYTYQELSGENTTLHFTYHFLDPKYGNDLKEVLDFVYETLFNPFISDSIIEELKYNYTAKINRTLDNPSRYANNQLIKLIGKDNHLSFKDIDLRYLLNDLTVKSVFDNYQNLINESDLYIYIIGDIEGYNFDNIQSWFKDRDRRLDYKYNKLSLQNLGFVEESKELSQSYLRLVYNTDYSNKDDTYYKWMVADALFGASSNSLLFKEVREKHSLCYSILSSTMKNEGLVIVSSAISYKDIDKVISLVDECVLRLINKEFDHNELLVTKKLLINSLLSNNDDAKNYVDFIHSNFVLKRNYTIEEIIGYIDDVTVDDVSDVMKTYKKSLTYVLKEDENVKN